MELRMHPQLRPLTHVSYFRGYFNPLYIKLLSREALNELKKKLKVEDTNNLIANNQ